MLDGTAIVFFESIMIPASTNIPLLISASYFHLNDREHL
jgi:hypothetical protein